jgi:hypothetical protein
VLRSILEDVKKARFFALLAEITSDISNKKQLTVCTSGMTSAAVIRDSLGKQSQSPSEKL